MGRFASAVAHWVAVGVLLAFLVVELACWLVCVIVPEVGGSICQAPMNLFNARYIASHCVLVTFLLVMYYVAQSKGATRESMHGGSEQVGKPRLSSFASELVNVRALTIYGILAFGLAGFLAHVHFGLEPFTIPGSCPDSEPLAELAALLSQHSASATSSSPPTGLPPLEAHQVEALQSALLAAQSNASGIAAPGEGSSEPSGPSQGAARPARGGEAEAEPEPEGEFAPECEGGESYRYAVWPWLPLAKVGGYILDFVFPLLLFPVMRHFMTMLRQSPAINFLSLDSNVDFHKYLGAFTFLPIALHVSMHYTWMALLPPETDNSNFYTRAFRSNHGITGLILLACMLLIGITALPPVRRCHVKIFGKEIIGFDIFWNTHALYWLLYTVLCFHSVSFIKWSFWPLAMFLLDKVLRKWYKRTQTVSSFYAGKITSGILEISARMDKAFHYKAGQWAFLRVKEVSMYEWHPFTISSNPEGREVTWHIATGGDWCKRLASLVKEQAVEASVGRDAATPGAEAHDGVEVQLSIQRGSILPLRSSHLRKVNLTLTVDGPYGSGSEHVFEYKKVIMISTGIGITPYFSILKSIHSRLLINEAVYGSSDPGANVPTTVYFFHVCRHRKDFAWVNPLLATLESDNFSSKVRFRFIVYVTRPGRRDRYAFGSISSVLSTASATSRHTDEEEPPAELPGEERHGRPDWNLALSDAAKELGEQAGKVGVFLCGSGAPQIQKACDDLNNSSAGTSFTFHKEAF